MRLCLLFFVATYMCTFANELEVESEQFNQQTCVQYTDCAGCIQDADCGWCNFPYRGTGKCIPGNEYGPSQGSCSSFNKTWYYSGCPNAPSPTWYNPYPYPSPTYYNPYPYPSPTYYNPYPYPSPTYYYPNPYPYPSPTYYYPNPYPYPSPSYYQPPYYSSPSPSYSNPHLLGEVSCPSYVGSARCFKYITEAIIYAPGIDSCNIYGICGTRYKMQASEEPDLFPRDQYALTVTFNATFHVDSDSCYTWSQSRPSVTAFLNDYSVGLPQMSWNCNAPCRNEVTVTATFNQPQFMYPHNTNTFRVEVSDGRINLCMRAYPTATYVTVKR